MDEQEIPDTVFDAMLLETLASTLGACISIYDRNDVLMFASQDMYRFFPVREGTFSPGSRLRSVLGSLYDSSLETGKLFFASANHVSREDWIAERVALHWRERHESIEQLPDGRWVRMGKRRLPGGLLIAFVMDISDQKRRDRELAAMRDQTELSRHILDNLANPVLVKDSELRFVLINDAFCRLLGFHAKNIIGRTASELVGKSDAASFEESERSVLETGVPFEFVEDITHADGTLVRSITRKHRSGMPGNYYVTVSVDPIIMDPAISAVLASTALADGDGGGNDACLPERPVPFVCAENGSIASSGQQMQASCKRILVADEDCDRGADLARTLSTKGIDAVSVSQVHEVFAFLDTARTMGLVIDRVEISGIMAAAIQVDRTCSSYPELAHLYRHGVSESAENVLNGKDRQPVMQPAARRRIKVLVAEDNEVNQIVFEQLLEGMGIDVRIVGNGAEVLPAWRENTPDIVLMDISMPVMNGFQAAQAIRTAEAEAEPTSHVPIIAVTAHAMSGDRERYMDAGMDGYLTKPVSPDKLARVIRNWIDDTRLTFVAA